MQNTQDIGHERSAAPARKMVSPQGGQNPISGQQPAPERRIAC